MAFNVHFQYQIPLKSIQYFWIWNIRDWFLGYLVIPFQPHRWYRIELQNECEQWIGKKVVMEF
jgi:hypothetical protein